MIFRNIHLSQGNGQKPTSLSLCLHKNNVIKHNRIINKLQTFSVIIESKIDNRSIDRQTDWLNGSKIGATLLSSSHMQAGRQAIGQLNLHRTEPETIHFQFRAYSPPDWYSDWIDWPTPSIDRQTDRITGLHYHCKSSPAKFIASCQSTINKLFDPICDEPKYPHSITQSGFPKLARWNYLYKNPFPCQMYFFVILIHFYPQIWSDQGTL